MLTKAPASAHVRGVAARSIARLIERGTPAEKIKGVWHVNADVADDWIEQHASRSAHRTKGPRLKRESPNSNATADDDQAVPANNPGELEDASSPDGDLQAVNRPIRHLDGIRDVFIETLSTAASSTPGRSAAGFARAGSSSRWVSIVQTPWIHVFPYWYSYIAVGYFLGFAYFCVILSRALPNPAAM